MGIVGRIEGRAINLPTRVIVGRGQAAGLRIPDPSVSNEHAVLSWRSERWRIRDLGSVNGTRVNGDTVKTGVQHPLRSGDVLTFGRAASALRLLDDAPPSLFARRTSDGVEAAARFGALGLPSAESPLLQIHPAGVGKWVCSTETQDYAVEDGQRVTVAGDDWQVFLPIGDEDTCRPDDAVQVQHLGLTFHVSRDEETVVISVRGTRRQLRLESRSHNYLLLLLARQRLCDDSLPQAEQGWLNRTELAQSLGISHEHLNVQLFRSRQAFTEAGIADASHLVETRRQPSQLRLGVQRLQILPL